MLVVFIEEIKYTKILLNEKNNMHELCFMQDGLLILYFVYF